MEDVTATLPPPSASVTRLAIVEIVIYTLLLPPTLYITWKHGKKGMTCWSILVSFFGMRFASDIYQVIQRTEPNIPGALLIITNAGSIACLTLALIGILYETNIVLSYPTRWTEKIIMGITNLINTAGIAMATYGGAPSATGSGGVISETLDKVGNILMLLVLLVLCTWTWSTWFRVWGVRKDPNFKPALYMVVATVAALPFQLFRIIYNTTYAFELSDRALDPIMGSFTTRFLFLFMTQLGCTIALILGGLLGICNKKYRQPIDEVVIEGGVHLSSVEENTVNRLSSWRSYYEQNFKKS